MGVEGRGGNPFDEQFDAGKQGGKPAEEEGRKSKASEGLPPQGLPQQPEEKLVYDSHNNPAPYSPSNIGEEPQEEIWVKWFRLPPLAKEDGIRRISRILANLDQPVKDRLKDRPDSFDRIGGFGGHMIFPPRIY